MDESPDTFSMTATKCFYNDFFTAVGIPQLTAVFCHWDQSWMGTIDPGKHRIPFERPTTMGSGGSDCPFIFRRLALKP